MAATVQLPPGAKVGAPVSAKKQYWATSLSGIVDETILAGLREVVARGEIGWLDIDLNYPIPPLEPGINRRSLG